MALEGNNDGSIIKWSLEVAFESSCSLVLECFLGDISVGGLFR